MRGRLAWGTLLAISLAGNAYLLVTKPRAQSATIRPFRPTRKIDHRQLQLQLPDFKPTPSRSVPTNYSKLDRAEIEQRLAHAERQIKSLRSPAEKFALAQRSPEIEAKVRPYLDEVFQRYAVKEPKYRFECRDRVCKVDSDIQDEWTLPLQQTYPTRSIFKTMAFEPEGTFIELHDPEHIPSTFLHGIIIATLVAAQTPCALSAAPRGDIATRLQFDASTRLVTATVGGSLATHPVAACFRKMLDESILKFRVPDDVTTSATFGPFTLSLPSQTEE